jgi:hypothetical protein
MATLTQIHDLNQFILSIPPNERDALSIDAIYERWRDQAFRTEDMLAVKASLQDFDNGERGRPVSEFLSDFDAERTPRGSSEPA